MAPLSLGYIHTMGSPLKLVFPVSVINFIVLLIKCVFTRGIRLAQFLWCLWEDRKTVCEVLNVFPKQLLRYKHHTPE